MSNLSTSAPEPTLSESYAECIRSFGTLLLSLGQKECRVVRLEQANFTALLEEYGRAKIWGDQTKADRPARARGSLDDTLRHDSELKAVVHGILQRLKALLNEASRIAERKLDPLGDTDQDSISSVSADSDSDSGEERDGPQRHSMPKICFLVQQILAQIRSLYSLSSLLRRPQVGGKYLRSIKAVLKDDSTSETIPLKAAFVKCDYSHIVEKVHLWRGPTKCEMHMEFDTEEAAPPGSDVSPSDVEDISWLCERLAEANTRRREQLRYWSDHPYDLRSEQATANRLEETIPARIHHEEVDRACKTESQVATVKPQDLDRQPEGPASRWTLSRQTFSAVAVSDVFDAKPNVRPRTVSAPTTVGKRQLNTVPDVPKTAKTDPFFSCPYCGMTLLSKDMRIRALWKRHVFQDLRPYTCTFEECQSAGKLFVSRNDWIYHELQVHRRQFTCRDCGKVYSDRDTMRVHLGAHYGKSVSPTQLEIILDICNRQIDDTQRELCLFCGEEFFIAALQDHLAGHMEDIALFVLPTNVEEEEDRTSIASALAAKVDSDDEGTGEASERSSLGFSNAGSLGRYAQNPADFANFLTVEEERYESKVSLWNERGGGQTARIGESGGAEDKTEAGGKSEANAEDERGLLRAAEVGNELLVLSLLDRGVAIEAKDEFGRTPLSLAAAVGREAVVGLLLGKGADPNLGDKYGRTPLSYAAKNGHEAIIKLLFATGKIDVNPKDNGGRTPLSYAAANGYEAIVKLLLATDKVDVNPKDNDGWTPLSCAAANGHEAIVKLLLPTDKLDVNLKDNDGRTPLSYAAANGHEDTVKLLLATGKVDVNSKDDYGLTPLLYATEKGHEAVIKLLQSKV
ncbi:hypothetical protein DL769_005329 [Monosporascus sp. CRB-8-3]|nr:hypothetical protein DL769_005329 [Monosporascus sp. CRB-8-3]